MGQERKARREARQRTATAEEVIFTAYGTELDKVTSFKYLGRILSADDSDWPAIYLNLKKARSRWARVYRVLSRTEANPRVSGYFYKAIIQSVLLYCCETWVVSKAVLRVLAGFHNRVARRLSGRLPYREQPGSDVWIYPPIEEALEIAGLHPIEHYIGVRQGNFVQHVATRPMMSICEEKEDGLDPRSRLHWWSPRNKLLENVVDNYGN